MPLPPPPQDNVRFTPASGRKTSHHASSSDHAPPPTGQDELKNTLGDEIDNHTWQFGAERFASFISRKIPKTDELPGNNRGSLDHYCLDVQEPMFQKALRDACQTFKQKRKSIEWPSTNAESAFYAPICTFLSECVSSCNDALDSIKYRGERLYSTLRFAPYDRPMMDGVDGANPLKPGGAGVLDDFDIAAER